MGQILQPAGIPYSALVTDPASASSTAPATPAMVQGAIGNSPRALIQAYVVYNLVTKTIIKSYNVTSVTYVSTGFIVVNFANPLPSANFAVIATACFVDSGPTITPMSFPIGSNTVSSCPFLIQGSNNDRYDITYFSSLFIGG